MRTFFFRKNCKKRKRKFVFISLFLICLIQWCSVVSSIFIAFFSLVKRIKWAATFLSFFCEYFFLKFEILYFSPAFIKGRQRQRCMQRAKFFFSNNFHFPLQTKNQVQVQALGPQKYYPKNPPCQSQIIPFVNQSKS